MHFIQLGLVLIETDIASKTGFLVTACSSKASTASNTYGNGLIRLTQKSFCSNIYSTNDSCDDVTVCKIIDDAREETFYVPLDRTDNISKE